MRRPTLALVLALTLLPLVSLAPPRAAAAALCSTDVDGNGVSDALTDGLLVIRHLFGFTGTTLTNGALAPDATRTDPAEIAAHIETHRTDFDVDANGETDALTDGLLIIRQLFGFSGTTLTNGALAPDATRTDPAAIAAYIEGLSECSATGLLNDTGIDWGGSYPSGNNLTCTSDGTIGAPQDCDQGRDATHNDPSDGHAGFSFTKLDADGNPLPASASTWSCVRDNVTGRTWEVKTDDGGIHDRDNTYRWGGKTVLGSGYGEYYSDWDSLVDGSNTEALCGHNDWRVPTIKELENLANRDGVNPAIDTDYFPNTMASAFWSSSPAASFFVPTSAWGWYVYYGDSHYSNRVNFFRVRLVRSGP